MKQLKAIQVAFCAIVFALLLVPSVGMLWAQNDSATGNQTLAPWPSLTSRAPAPGASTAGSLASGDATSETSASGSLAFGDAGQNGDGDPNLRFFSDWGEWFDDHFAYHNQVISLNATIRAALFGVSASDQVILGSDGWFYYGGTKNDYVGIDPLSDRELFCIAHNLREMQEFTTAQGASFAFTLAPNKNSLYPEHMPGFYVRSNTASNSERLKPYLEDFGVNYVDLFSTFGDAMANNSDPLYLLRDSHWDNRGALIADTALSKELGIAPLKADDWTWRDDFIGDLDAMLFPDMMTPEHQFYLPGINDGTDQTGAKWSYSKDYFDESGEVYDSVEDSLLGTEGQGKGTLVMYRDSFANALIPFFAAQTDTAEFSKLIPYNAWRVIDQKADYVLVERAERHLDYLAQEAPIMPSRRVPIDSASAKEDAVARGASSLDAVSNGSLLSFFGTIDARVVADDSLVYVSFEQEQGSGSGGGSVASTGNSASAGNSASGATASGGGAANPQAANALSGEVVYEAFLLCPKDSKDDNGYLAYIPQTNLPAGRSIIRVYIAQGDDLLLVQSMQYDNP